MTTAPIFRAAVLFTSIASAQGAEPERISFNQHIRPIFSDKCFSCHGFDAKHRKADLRLDTAEGAYADNDGVRAIVPGDLEKSEAWKRILSKDEDEVMPPPDSHKTLSEAERALIKRWIEQGATYQKHWSFEAPAKSAPPATNATHAIDAFIDARLQRAGLQRSPEADRPTLIRRVALALTGLPPKPADVDAFTKDPAPDAYEKMVDRYLASPHFGEEMARHWLDIARYADTHGLHLDNERQMWAYRDWVVKAFNQNLPFDQFTIQQLAGDLLPNPTTDQLIATGFNRCNVTTSEGGSIEAEWVFRYAVDRASTTAQAWMGLTAGCAMCHDHKFDPISQKEFYQLYAFFHSAADPAMDGNALLTRPVLKLASDEQKTKLAEFDAKIASKQKEVDAAAQKIAYVDPATVQPRPAAQDLETLWFDDDFPAGAKIKSGPGAATVFATKAQGGTVHSGERALKRTGKGITQDYYEGGSAPLTVPPSATIFAHVFLDPTDPPKAVMLQFHKGDWKHRAVWGDYEAIQWGAVNTTERVHMGPLPATSMWVRLEVPAEKLGLKPGDQLTGIAFTQFDGTVSWDTAGVKGRNDPAEDPARSFLAWRKSRAGKDTQGAPPEINKLLKQGVAKELKGDDEKRLREYYLQHVCMETKAQFGTIAAELATLKQQKEDFDKAIPSTFIYNDLAKPRESFVMERGAYDKPGAKVEPATPAVFPPLKKEKADGRATRLDLARWLIAAENPLTARVAANRLWQQFFGMGLVKSSGDFGSQGEPPSHPELLDWLAVTYRENGWDTKAFIRLLLTSQTFRQSSKATPALVQKDPENRLLARGPRFRLDAEQIRDSALFVSGLINLEFGGKGVKTYQPPNIWEPVGFAGSNTRFYKQDSGPALYRRSIYTFLKRTAPAPFMSNFDAPNREQICTGRERSNTPLQALQLMNDVQYVEAARALADRMLREGGKTSGERIAFAFRTVLSRAPEPAEVAILEKQLAAHTLRFNQNPEAAKQLITQGESKPNAAVAPAELAAHTMVASALLNLDETICRN
jgi:mono/diheme cytochrome c family protein